MSDGTRLGRGLGALLAPRTGDLLPVPRVAGAEFREVPVDAIRPNPRQPRTSIDEDALGELAQSIAAVGLLQPLVVRAVGPDRFEIVMGERRWRAAQLAGLQTLPVLVRETADDAMLRDALLENLHREGLSPLEEAAAYAQLLSDFGVTHEALAARLGRSRAHISNTLRLLNLPAAVQRRVAAGVLSAGHARALLALADVEAQDRLATRIVAEGLSVRAVEEIVAVGAVDGERRPRRAAARRSDPALARLADALSERFDTRVRVEAGRRKGRIVIDFGALEDLQRIVAAIAPDALDAAAISPD